MTIPLVFVRRQSPDWGALSADFRAGCPIDPARYVPDHDIPGFPPRVDLLIEQWNNRFALDFFTFRHRVARLSRANVLAVEGACAFDHGELDRAADVVRKNEGAYVYFHDDDDFFSPRLAAALRAAQPQADAVVTPLFRVGAPTWTFVRRDAEADPIWGRREDFHFRYQTNNYGISGRRCRDPEALRALKDHHLASIHADANGYEDQWLPTPLSATVKTPASASALRTVFESDADPAAAFAAFVEEAGRTAPPAGCDWIAAPLREIIGLVGQVTAGARRDSRPAA